MVSSTFYDLRQIRDDLRQFIEGLAIGRCSLSILRFPSILTRPQSRTVAAESSRTLMSLCL